MCLCPDCLAPILGENNTNHAEDLEAEHPEECACQDCHDDREAIKDREFDERIALGYFI